ncbi:MAG: hypothetical protein ACLFTQ_03740 [Candidatus Aenigmatarchaeota archaeon]
MKLVFEVDKDEKSRLDGVIDEDPVARLSITERNGETLGIDKEGVFVVLEGDEEICEEAREKITEFGEELEAEDRKEVIEAVEAEEEEAAEGFGSIFGE